MQRNDITKLLGIQGVRVTNLETPEECGAYEYYGAAEPQFRWSLSHQSGTTEPPIIYSLSVFSRP